MQYESEEFCSQKGNIHCSDYLCLLTNIYHDLIVMKQCPLIKSKTHTNIWKHRSKIQTCYAVWIWGILFAERKYSLLGLPLSIDKHLPWYDRNKKQMSIHIKQNTHTKYSRTGVKRNHFTQYESEEFCSQKGNIHCSDYLRLLTNMYHDLMVIKNDQHT